MKQPTRQTLKNLPVPFLVYAVNHRDEWYVASGNRYRPIGKAVVVTEVYNADPHSVEGTTQDGKLIIFGGPSAKHWIIEDPTAEAPEYEHPGPVRERPNAQGANHYLNKLPPHEKDLNIKLRSIGRALTMATEKLNSLAVEVERTKEHIDRLTSTKNDLRKKLSDQKGNQT